MRERGKDDEEEKKKHRLLGETHERIHKSLRVDSPADGEILSPAAWRHGNNMKKVEYGGSA